MTVEKLSEHTLRPKYDGKLIISEGRSRFEKNWKNKTTTWGQLLKRLSSSLQTAESHAEYMKMPKDRQSQIKDIGGFVGGHLKEGKRKIENVLEKQIITLDLDFPPENFWEELTNNLELSGAAAVYSTHKYSEKTPRYRLIMPLDRTVGPDEYEAIARKVAEHIGIDYFDDSSFQPSRLMYWPSHSRDVEPFFRFRDEPFLSADAVLAEYPDWTDISYWPESSRMTGIRKKMADRQGDPTEKKGLIGAFCRTYGIREAIGTFLADVYVPTAREDRYTYAAGSSAAGLVVYDDDLFAFSNHGTDPAGGQLCNAFDLVRIHKFGHLDEGAEDKTTTKRPSYKAMIEFVQEDKGTRLTLGRELRDQAADDFAEDPDPDTWRSKLTYDKQGNLTADMRNIMLILRNDSQISGIRYNELSHAIEAGKLPWDRPDKYWRDADEAQLYVYVSLKYSVKFPENLFGKALTTVTDERRFNPLRDYVTGLPEWDGTPRVDRLLVDYLGAEDTPYTRAVTRKTLTGAVQRVLEPGCKFDTVLVLVGRPGIGKSTILRKLGGEWFSDSLSLADTRDKTAAEKLQGQWIVEIGEMQGSRKADIDVMKGFLSRQVDEYRPAYGRVTEKHPRTAIICGTTNSTNGFLKDTTGNRRFWPVPVSGDGRLDARDITEETRAQIWAEAFAYASEGEEVYLDDAMEREAEKMQQAMLEYDEREGQVVEYLDTLLPADWYSWPPYKRVDYFQQYDELEDQPVGTMQRTVVCSLEIFTECFGRNRNSWKKQDSYEIAAIMARIPEWEKTGRLKYIAGFGRQRPFSRRANDGTSSMEQESEEDNF